MMSTFLDIIPTIESSITWSELKERWLAYLNEQQRQIIGSEINLILVKPRKIVNVTELLEIGGYYNFELAIPNTLDLSVYTNQQVMIAGHEQELVEDTGRNLTADTIQKIAQEWSEVGYDYTLTSYAGRGKYELGLMIALASALASFCEGWIQVASFGFGASPNMYTAEEFLKVQPNPPDKF